MGTGGTLRVLRMTAPNQNEYDLNDVTNSEENTPQNRTKSSQQSERRIQKNARIRKSYLCVKLFNRKSKNPMLQWNQLPSVIQTMLALILVLALGLCEAVISDDLVVSTTKGKIRGVTLKSATNK